MSGRGLLLPFFKGSYGPLGNTLILTDVYWRVDKEMYKDRDMSLNTFLSSLRS